MRYRGRFQLGQFVHLSVQTTTSGDNDAGDGAVTPAVPDAAPTISIYDTDGDYVIKNKKIPLQSPQETTLFGVALMLECLSTIGPAYGTVEFAEGERYVVLYKWQVSGSNYATLDFFDVIAGGDCRGAYTALEFYERPQADYMVGALEDGTVEKRRGPSI